MNTHPTLTTLAVLATLPFATLSAAAEARAIAMVEHEVELIQAGGNVTVEGIGQLAQGDEARKHIEEARKHAQQAREHAGKVREEIRLRMPADIVRMPDTSGLAEAFANSVAYSFTTGNVKSVKNAPYTGEIINERIQTLADGNQLVKKSSNRVYRDSQGATRQEILDSSGQLKTVHIRDAEGTRFVLTPSRKSALKIASPKNLIHAKTGLLSGKSGKDSDATLVIKRSEKGETVVNSTENIIVKRVDGDGKEKREEIRVQVGPRNFAFSGNEGMAALGKLGELGELSHLSELATMGDAFNAAGDAFSMAWRHGEPSFVRMDKSYERTTTSLGSKSFDGVIAEGKMVSYTIPTGKVGNAKPITVSSETWYSQDLQITVYSKHSDPRSGEVIYRVANLKRGEQSTDLFRVPADFEVTDPMAKLTGAIKIERTEKK